MQRQTHTHTQSFFSAQCYVAVISLLSYRSIQAPQNQSGEITVGINQYQATTGWIIHSKIMVSTALKEPADRHTEGSQYSNIHKHGQWMNEWSTGHFNSNLDLSTQPLAAWRKIGFTFTKSTVDITVYMAKRLLHLYRFNSSKDWHPNGIRPSSFTHTLISLLGIHPSSFTHTEFPSRRNPPSSFTHTDFPHVPG